MEGDRYSRNVQVGTKTCYATSWCGAAASRKVAVHLTITGANRWPVWIKAEGRINLAGVRS